MRRFLQVLLVGLAAVAPFATPAATIEPLGCTPTAELATYTYDATPVQGVFDNTLPDPRALARPVPSLDQVVGLDAAESPYFSGKAKPWTEGATPNSIYTHIDPKTGKAVQNAIYDDTGNVVGHVDFKNHGPSAPSGHGHSFPEPGNPASGHGPGKPHIPGEQLPPGWNTLPSDVQPHTEIGR